jgi:hypothetical protein
VRSQEITLGNFLSALAVASKQGPIATAGQGFPPSGSRWEPWEAAGALSPNAAAVSNVMLRYQPARIALTFEGLESDVCQRAFVRLGEAQVAGARFVGAGPCHDYPGSLGDDKAPACTPGSRTRSHDAAARRITVHPARRRRKPRSLKPCHSGRLAARKISGELRRPNRAHLVRKAAARDDRRGSA